MVRISPEEKRRETADWFKGLLGIILIFGIVIVGYLIFQNTKSNISQQNYQPQKTSPSSPKA